MNRLRINLVDALGVIAALLLAAGVRFDGQIPPDELRLVILVLPAVVVGKLVALHLFHCDQWSFRYAGPSELRSLLAALSLGTLLSWAFTYLVGPAGASRGTLLLEPLFSLFLLGAYRFGFRVLPDRFVSPIKSSGTDQTAGRSVIIIGAGDAGVMTLHEIRKHPQSDMNVVGFIDDDALKKGIWIDGVRVIGGREEIAAAVAALNVDELIIAIPSASGEVMRELVAACREVKSRFRVVPGLLSIIKGDVDFERIRELRPEDLLGREMTEIRPDVFHESMEGRKVLITGAGGSIGSEIARQLMAAGAQIVLLDHSETAIYLVSQELERLRSRTGSANGGSRERGQAIRSYIADIRHAERIRGILDQERPEYVFHAAAFKHVPLMEDNIAEAITTNILGTKIMVEAAERAGTKRFVFISTDKAVRPTSVMGATKRAAEYWLFSSRESADILSESESAVFNRKSEIVNLKSEMTISAVRFGNVFGSSGSAPLLFRRQIESGGPVTVTHPHVVRFFMTVAEAVFLVIQASLIGDPESRIAPQSGVTAQNSKSRSAVELFVLEMGQPIRILDLAKNMITLSGLRPDIDIPIVFTGLRPGEKLFEEVLTEGEHVEPTSEQKIFRITPNDPGNIAPANFIRDFQELEKSGAIGLAGLGLSDDAALREILKRMVPEYTA